MPTPMTLAEAVTATRAAREEVVRLRTELHQRMQLFEDANASVIDGLAQARDHQAAMEQATRDLGLLAWVGAHNEDPHASKTVYPGVQIRERMTLLYDSAEALAWAQAGNRLAVQPECLHVEVFEAIAKRFPQQVPFVVQSPVYQVILAKQL